MALRAIVRRLHAHGVGLSTYEGFALRSPVGGYATGVQVGPDIGFLRAGSSTRVASPWRDDTPRRRVEFRTSSPTVRHNPISVMTTQSQHPWGVHCCCRHNRQPAFSIGNDAFFTRPSDRSVGVGQSEVRGRLADARVAVWRRTNGGLLIY